MRRNAVARRRFFHRPVIRPDESMQDHRHPADIGTWSTYIFVMVALLGSAAVISVTLDLGWQFWLEAFFGALIIASLISLAVLPSLRRR